jgi:hypothetical protein
VKLYLESSFRKLTKGGYQFQTHTKKETKKIKISILISIRRLVVGLKMEFNESNQENKRNESAMESMDPSLQLFEKDAAINDPSHHQHIITTDNSISVIETNTEPFPSFQNNDLQESHRSMYHTGDEEEEGVEESFAADRRLIELERTKTTANAKADLEDVLNRIHDVTNTLLQEMSGFLQTMSEVELGYVKVLKSQQSEKIRLENVVPDITDTTNILL